MGRIFSAFLSTTLIATVGTTSAFAQVSQNEIKSIMDMVENNYGPIEMKKQSIGLDWKQYRAKGEASLLSSQSTEEFYYGMANFMAGLNDAHVSLEIPSNFTVKLPMQFTAIGNATIVNYVAKNVIKKLEKFSCAANVGDELLSFNGTAIDQHKSTLLQFRKYGNDLTNSAMSTRAITQMSEARGYPIINILNKKTVKLQMKRSNGELYTCELPWRISGVPIISRDKKDVQLEELLRSNKNRRISFKESLLADAESNTEILETNEILDNISEEDLSKVDKLNSIINKIHALMKTETKGLNDGFDAKLFSKKEDTSENGKYISLGHTEPVFTLPKNFKRLRPHGLKKITDAAGFFAGTFKHGEKGKEKTVGYLRIPSYMPQNPAFMLPSIRWYIAKLEKKTDYLIIDQVNNPGGMVVFSDMIVHSLVGNYDDSKHMNFIFRPTQSLLRMYAEVMVEVASADDKELPKEIREKLVMALRANFDKIHDAYVNYQMFTDPISLKTITELVEALVEQATTTVPFKFFLRMLAGADFTKHQVYTKPVYMLINEYDFSGGDATPALLQDYGRVKLIGERTAGAGGSVGEFKNDVMNSFEFSLTESLMVRKDGKLVENYGVTPDIHFPMTREDVASGYEKTLDRIMEVITKTTP